MEDVIETQLSQAQDELRGLAIQVGCEEALFGAQTHGRGLQRAATNVGFIGGANVGKSSRINGMLARPLLPVSLIHDRAVVSIQASLPGKPEQAVVDGAALALEHLPAALTRPGAEVEIRIDDALLRLTSMKLVERSDFDPSAREPGALAELLEELDVVVLVLDARAPMSRGDVAVLQECGRLAVATVVVLSRVDALDVDERTVALAYTHKILEEAGIAAELVESGYDHSADGADRALRAAVASCIGNGQFRASRLQRWRLVLLDALTDVEAAALAVQTLASASRMEQEAALRVRRDRLANQSLAWQRIEQLFDQRRRELEAKVLERLKAKWAVEVHRVTIEIERVPDLRKFWNKTLPEQLAKIIQDYGEQVVPVVRTEFAKDAKWLSDTLARELATGMDVRAPLEELLHLVAADTTFQTQLSPWDAQKLRTRSRIGTAVSAVALGVLLGPTAIAGAVVGANILAQLYAERFVDIKIADSREAARVELQSIMGDMWMNFVAELSAVLKSVYQPVIRDLKLQQLRWEQCQTDALTAAARNAGQAKVSSAAATLASLAALRLRLETVNPKFNF